MVLAPDEQEWFDAPWRFEWGVDGMLDLARTFESRPFLWIAPPPARGASVLEGENESEKHAARRARTRELLDQTVALSDANRIGVVPLGMYAYFGDEEQFVGASALYDAVGQLSERGAYFAAWVIYWSLLGQERVRPDGFRSPISS